jgi:hypothetical protein
MASPKTYTVVGEGGEKLLLQVLYCMASKQTQMVTVFFQLNSAGAPASLNVQSVSTSLRDYPPLVPYIGKLTIELVREFDDGRKARPVTVTLERVPIEWIA